MLQPNQPMGLPQQPKPMGVPQGMPQQAPQGMPAGAAQATMLKPGGITSNISEIKDAYAAEPQKLEQAAKTDFLAAIAWQQLVSEQEAKARDLKLKEAQQTGQQPPTVIQQRQQQALELRKQDLEQQQAKRLQSEQQRGQQGMQQLAQQISRGAPPQGIAGIPAPNAAEPRAMAAGGIVAFDEGGDVNPPTNQERSASDAEVDEMLRRNPGLTIQNARNILAGRPITRPEEGKPQGLRSIIEGNVRRDLTANRGDAEVAGREQAMRYMGYTPEEKAAQEKRIGEMEAYDKAAYAPERLQNEGLAAFLLGAGGRGNIGSVMQGAGVAGLNYSNKMRELARQRMEDRQKKSEDWMEAQRGVRTKAFELGQKEGTAADTARGTALREGTNLLEADIRAAHAAQAGGSPEDKRLLTVLARINNDDQIANLLKDREKNRVQAGTPEYQWYQDQINKIRKAYFDEAGIKQPSMNIQYDPYPAAPEKKSGFSIVNWFGGGDNKAPPAPPPGFVAQ